MRTHHLPTRMLLAVAAAATLAVVLVPLAATAPSYSGEPRHPFVTAVAYNQTTSVNDPVAYNRVKAAGALAARVGLYWPTIATRRPLNPANPADGAYSWTAYDNQIKLIAARGMTPLVMIYGTPIWARDSYGGPGYAPVPAALADFMRAAVARYSGTFQSLPRVKYWQIWAEPNINVRLSPQFKNGRSVAPAMYRTMLNAIAGPVHSVPGNLIVGGGLAPFAHTGSALTMAPLAFLREMLCMSTGSTPHATCSAKTNFDIWGIHPYTNGSPWHHAENVDDVSIPEIPQMQRLIQAAVAAGHVVSAQPVRYWVTEFSWDSKPPVTFGVDQQLEARWVSEAFFRMWMFKIEVVTWLSLRDVTGAPAGLYFQGATFTNDVAKPALNAFRFPFVAYPTKAGVFVWGRTPSGKPAIVTIERKSGTAWSTTATLKTDQYGVFAAVLPTAPTGVLRARNPSTTSPEFTVAPPTDVKL
ncbi:MAG: hypothetical protein QOE36_2714 [Gaiellaceae bacterium]|nr:hypothetical protein [Gaiellaceae bacterium]